MTKSKYAGETYVLNGLAVDITDFEADMSGEVWYEVLRLSDRKFLFLDDHLQRLKTSLQSGDLTYPGNEIIYHSLTVLLKNNSLSSGNIRICIERKKGEQLLLCYFIPHHYPTALMYQEGVKMMSFSYERPLPGIKKWNKAFRQKVGSFISEKRIYEALLVNNSGKILEGSRSNIFFLDREGNLLTPGVNDVLAGITRKYVIQICDALGFKIREKDIFLEDLHNFEACFISGTSPGILPVSMINDIHFRADHRNLGALMEEYQKVALLKLKEIYKLGH